MTDIDEVITRAHREEWARVVATLARRLGDLDIAEEMAADAFATAVERWPVDGVPPNPGAWLTTTAHRKAIDRLRREARREEKTREALMLSDTAEPLGAIDDDRLRLVFTCCHPALAMEARVALTPRMVHRAPRSPTRSWSRRPPWATGSPARRRRSRRQRSPYGVPLREDLPARITGVLAVLYLIFNEGYLASDPDKEAVRGDLTAEAIRLTWLGYALMPADGEVAGLLALMLLTEARRAARVSASGELVARAIITLCRRRVRPVSGRLEFVQKLCTGRSWLTILAVRRQSSPG
jgi:RNA polymerase sigma-70 factor (ECF subfamily)